MLTLSILLTTCGCGGGGNEKGTTSSSPRDLAEIEAECTDKFTENNSAPVSDWKLVTFLVGQYDYPSNVQRWQGAQDPATDVTVVDELAEPALHDAQFFPTGLGRAYEIKGLVALSSLFTAQGILCIPDAYSDWGKSQNNIVRYYSNQKSLDGPNELLNTNFSNNSVIFTIDTFKGTNRDIAR